MRHRELYVNRLCFIAASLRCKAENKKDTVKDEH